MLGDLPTTGSTIPWIWDLHLCKSGETTLSPSLLMLSHCSVLLMVDMTTPFSFLLPYPQRWTVTWNY